LTEILKFKEHAKDMNSNISTITILRQMLKKNLLKQLPTGKNIIEIKPKVSSIFSPTIK
jgi:hypothetical protein